MNINITDIVGFATVIALIWQVMKLSESLNLQRITLEKLSEQVGLQTTALSKLDSQISIQEKTYLKDHERRKKQATIEALNLLRTENYDARERAVRSKKIHTWAACDSTDLDEVRILLSRYEKFSAAVNANIYDVDVVDSVCGAHIQFIWTNYKGYANYIRDRERNERVYCETEKLATDVKSRRETNSHKAAKINQ